MKTQAGITLLEIVLVIAVGAMLILLGIRQYQIFKVDSDVLQVQANVDQLFKAMSKFYQVQCYGTNRLSLLNPLPPPTYGQLHPRSTTATTFPITNINTELVASGYLTATNFPISPILNTTGSAAPFNGYVLQFNRSTSTRVIDPGSMQTGTTVLWRIQVAVLLQDPATAVQYLRLLKGDCLSNLQGSTVTPCAGAGIGSGNYVVFERLPSFSTSDTENGLLLLNATGKQFTNMYRVNPITNLTTSVHTPTEFQYYVCGG